MMQEVLLQAIGGLDEAMLAESEESITVKPKRILWRTVVIAATLAMLTIGVAAVGIEFLYPMGTPKINATNIHWKTFRLDENNVATEEVINEDMVTGVRISMNFPTNEDVPLVLETPYMIHPPEHWVSCGYTSGKVTLGDGTQGISQFSVSWEPYADADGVISGSVGESIDDYVIFRQYSAYYYNSEVGGKNYLDSLLGIPSRVTLSSELTTIADIPVLKVTIPAFDLTEAESLSLSIKTAYMDAGEVRLYWSDGDSIMSLIYPAWMTDEEIAEILGTIYVVEDLEAMLEDIETTE